MSEHNITVNGGNSVRLPTAGKYCDRDIIVTAEKSGIELPELISPGSAPDLMSGKQMLDGEGKVVDGTFTLAAEMTEQDSLIEQIKIALQGKAVTSDPVIEPLEVTENGTYNAPDGVHGYSPVTVNVAASGGNTDLPAGYSRVDYIELNGKQLVDTGIIGNQNTQIRASFTWGSSTQNHLFGCASSDNTKSITSFMNGSWRFGSKSATKTIQKNNNDLPYSALINKSVIGVTGNRSSISDVPDFETVATLLLGGARSANGELPSSGLIGKIFYFYLWDGDTPVRKMIPVTDGTAFRFWDTVSRQFFDSITDVPLEGGNV